MWQCAAQPTSRGSQRARVRCRRRRKAQHANIPNTLESEKLGALESRGSRTLQPSQPARPRGQSPRPFGQGPFELALFVDVVSSTGGRSSSTDLVLLSLLGSLSTSLPPIFILRVSTQRSFEAEFLGIPFTSRDRAPLQVRSSLVSNTKNSESWYGTWPQCRTRSLGAPSDPWQHPLRAVGSLHLRRRMPDAGRRGPGARRSHRGLRVWASEETGFGDADANRRRSSTTLPCDPLCPRLEPPPKPSAMPPISKECNLDFGVLDSGSFSTTQGGFSGGRREKQNERTSIPSFSARVHALSGFRVVLVRGKPALLVLMPSPAGTDSPASSGPGGTCPVRASANRGVRTHR